MGKYESSPSLKSYPLKNFSKGYNSYANSKTLIKDEEIPYGKNVWLDDNGSLTKRPGSAKHGGEIVAGKAPKFGAQFRTTGVNELIVACGTLWKKKNGASWDTLSGLTFTDDKEWDFCQTIGTTYGSRLYGANGVDKLAYYDGTTITEQTANGNVGSQVVAYNGRLYMNNTTYPDRIYFSNPWTYDATDGSFSIADFGTFDTSLVAGGGAANKNAGWISLDPGSGLVIKKLKVYSSSAGVDSLYVWTDRNLWKIVPVSTLDSSGALAHSIQVIVDGKGTPAPKSVVQVGNDVKFYDYDNIYSLGEQAQYQNIRLSTLSGRIKSEIDGVATAGKDNVAMEFFKDRLWFSYMSGMSGTYNDRIEIWDSRLNAWSAPFEGLNIGWFLDFVETDGTHRWLGGSSNSANSYIYELQTGVNDDDTAVSATFEDKSIDCGMPGLIKRFAFIDVFYALLYGTLTYEVFIDEVLSVTGQVQLGNSSSLTSGIGALPIGSFAIGDESTPGQTFASVQKNSSFRIDCNYAAGKKISTRFTNNNTGEQFTINSKNIWFLPGDINETG
jgi:hypothetical protein